MQIFARPAVVRRLGMPLAPGLLLEGSWPAESDRRLHWALDELLSPAWHRLDAEAQRLAREAAQAPLGATEARRRAARLADRNSLRLQYALAKLLRVVAGLDAVLPRAEALGGVASAPGSGVATNRLLADRHLRLWAERGRDEDYAALMESFVRSRGGDVGVHWVEVADAPAKRPPANSAARKLASRLVERCLASWDRWAGRQSPDGSNGGSLRVILVGNPQRLGAVAGELLAREARVGWLMPRFGWRLAAAWCPRGVCPLVADGTGVHADPSLPLPRVGPLLAEELDLGPAVEVWLGRLARTEGRQQLALAADQRRRIDEFAADWLVTDEDATPFARSAVREAQSLGVSTAVVQHGAPLVRFGFTPLAAELLFAWGNSTVEQMTAWGADRRQLVPVGSPWHEGFLAEVASYSARAADSAKQVPGQLRRGPTVLLLGTVPPRDERPDALSLALTVKNYRELLEAALECLGRIPGARLVVRPHPRAAGDWLLRELCERQLPGRCRWEARRPLAQLVAESDVVLACASSAGVDAALAGRPVIQLLPPPAADLLPAASWGQWGTAHDAGELERLLAETLDGQGFAPNRALLVEAEVAAGGRLDEGGPLESTAGQANSGTWHPAQVLSRWPGGAAAKIVDELVCRAASRAGQRPIAGSRVPDRMSPAA